jgi:hypothetical protein
MHNPEERFYEEEVKCGYINHHTHRANKQYKVGESRARQQRTLRQRITPHCW